LYCISQKKKCFDEDAGYLFPGGAATTSCRLLLHFMLIGAVSPLTNTKRGKSRFPTQKHKQQAALN
jgi:hypothetical protein